MAVALGKRKSRADVVTLPRKAERIAQQPEESDNEDLKDAFRKAFEAKFRPLSRKKKEEADNDASMRRSSTVADTQATEVEDLRDDEDEDEDIFDDEDASSGFEGLSEEDEELEYEPM